MAKPYLRGSVWWIIYWRNGKPYRESSGSRKISDAKALLKRREGEVAKGEAITPAVGRLRFDEAAADVVNDYRMNAKRSLPDVESRIANHLTPFFGGRRMIDVTPSHVREYVVSRQAAGAANATINRELAVLKRAFVLAVQSQKLLARPHIPMLQENNARQGFFEPEAFEAVRRNLPEPVRRLVTFECITGWRNYSEVYPMQWSWVDFTTGTVTLPPGIAKNKAPRVFPMTAELRAVLMEQRAHVDRLQRELGRIIPHVWCWDDGRRVRDFRKAWKIATIAAGCPGRVPHDFRRTAVRSLERAGVSRSVAMAMTGHKTEAVYRRYAIVAEADLHDAARRLERAAK